jgi:hypothetical protein
MENWLDGCSASRLQAIGRFPLCALHSMCTLATFPTRYSPRFATVLTSLPSHVLRCIFVRSTFMASASSATLQDEELWPATLKINMVVLDFDKTITNKHTRGAIFQSSEMTDDVLSANFADLEFFRRVCLLLVCNSLIGVPFR